MIKETRTVSCDKCGQDIHGDYNEVVLKYMVKKVYHVCRGCWARVQADIFSAFDGREPQERPS